VVQWSFSLELKVPRRLGTESSRSYVYDIAFIESRKQLQHIVQFGAEPRQKSVPGALQPTVGSELPLPRHFMQLHREGVYSGKTVANVAF
jgi:hypothetical protein